MRTGMIALAGLALAMIAGCGDGEPVRIATASHVLLVDKNLAPQVEIVRQTADRVGGDLMRVRTEIRNRTKGDIWVDIQVAWKDKDGFELYKTAWAPKRLPAGMAEPHEIVSMGSNAVDYEFRIRRPVKSRD